MKVRLIVAIIIFVIVIGGGIFQEIHIKNVSNELSERLLSIEKDQSFSLEETEKTIEWWNEKSNVLELFISHEPVHEIFLILNELKGAIIADDAENASISLYAALASNKNMLDKYRLKLANIL